MEALHLDHVHLTKVFNILDQQSQLISADEGRNGKPDIFLMVDIAHYVKNYPDLIHHPKEDRVYEVFKTRTNEGADIVDQVQNEHKLLPNETNELYTLLEAAANSALFISRDELRSKIQHFLALERNHMNIEEQVLFPLIESTLTEEDWDSIDTATLNKSDPLFGDNIEACYENLYRSIKSQGGVK